MAILLPDDYLTDIMKKEYEKQHEGKPEAEVAEARANRLAGYMSICISGLATLYWTDAGRMLTNTHQDHPNLAYLGVLYSLAVLLSNLAGVAAASFPLTTPWAMGVAGFASWQAMLFVLATFHFSTFKIHPKLLHCFITLFISSSFMSIFWGICGQDPVVLHALAKYSVWGVCQLYIFLTRQLKKAHDAAGSSPLLSRVIASFHTARDFVEANPGFLPAEFMTNITVKGYLKDKSKEEIEKEEGIRLKAYLSMSMSGITNLYWTGAAAILLELNETNSTEAYRFVLYSIFSLTVMLISVIVATFPTTAPVKMELAGLGAWQAAMFVISTFHLSTFKIHLETQHFWISMIVFSILFSIFWGISSQDPLFIHVAAKFILWCFSLLVYGIYIVGRKIFSGGRALLFGANHGNDSSLQPLLSQQQVSPHGHVL